MPSQSSAPSSKNVNGNNNNAPSLPPLPNLLPPNKRTISLPESDHNNATTLPLNNSASSAMAEGDWRRKLQLESNQYNNAMMMMMMGSHGGNANAMMSQFPNFIGNANYLGADSTTGGGAAGVGLGGGGNSTAAAATGEGGAASTEQMEEELKRMQKENEELMKLISSRQQQLGAGGNGGQQQKGDDANQDKKDGTSSEGQSKSAATAAAVGESSTTNNLSPPTGGMNMNPAMGMMGGLMNNNMNNMNMNMMMPYSAMMGGMNDMNMMNFNNSNNNMMMMPYSMGQTPMNSNMSTTNTATAMTAANNNSNITNNNDSLKLPSTRKHPPSTKALTLSLETQEDPNWEERFSELLTFKSQHGHTRVPARYKHNPKLGRWVMTQRRQFTVLMQGFPSALTTERMNRLNEIGFVWALRADPVTMWNRKFGELKAYKKLFGNCMVPQRYQREFMFMVLFVLLFLLLVVAHISTHSIFSLHIINYSQSKTRYMGTHPKTSIQTND